MIDMDQEVKSILERIGETFIMLNMPNMVTGVLVLVGAMEHLDTMERLVDKTAERVSELEQEIVRLEAEVSDAK